MTTIPGPELRRAPRGIGLGLRWEFLEEVIDGPTLDIDFFEVSPENYMRRGGYYPAALGRVRDRYPIVTHGLTLSLGAEREPDVEFVAALRDELDRLETPWHSDHLAVTSAGPRSFHELLPLRFARDAVPRIADRIDELSERLGRPMALENVTYYAHPGEPELAESELIAGILERTQAGLLLDVNNVYVNAINHDFDPLAFIEALPLERVIEIHVAGHLVRPDGLLIDNHGAPVIPSVLELLSFSLARTGPVPVLLERDNLVPSLDELVAEVGVVRSVVDAALGQERRASNA